MNDRCLIIAEAGVNHNGNIQIALDLVDRAAESGADMIKFQTFRASRLASLSAPKADYQKRNTGSKESQHEMLARLELSAADHQVLIQRCTDKGIKFLSTAGETESFHFLAEDLGLKIIKLGSGELTNAPLLIAAGRSNAKLILSTGMGTLSEIEEALGVLAFALKNSIAPPSRAAFAEALHDPSILAQLRDKVTLLHCTTEYPSDVNDTNLRAIQTMNMAFGLPVGYSDHTEGLEVSLAAVARGAVAIEKHFTLDRTLPGPDHAASLEPAELTSLVTGIRKVEASLGDGRKRPGPIEVANRRVVRRSVIARRALDPSVVLTEDDITVKRPGDGISAMDYWDCIGRRLIHAVECDTPLQWSNLSWVD